MRVVPQKTVRFVGVVVISAVFLIVLFNVFLRVAQKLYGGPRVVVAGEAHGFVIGMTKPEVFRRYKELNESANISCSGAELTNGYFALEARPADLKFSREFEIADHWTGYRRKWPIWFQEFYFYEGRLTNITTYIRFYEPF